MRGIRINFAESGAVFDLTSYTKDFDCTIQNALVNVGTDRNSDPWFAERGTDLRIDGAHGRMATAAWANQSANFAALRTLSFSQNTEVDNNFFKLQKFTLRCQTIKLDTVELFVRAVSTTGQAVGGLATV